MDLGIADFPHADWPIFDLGLPGPREDSHTSPKQMLAEQQAWAVSNWVDKLKTMRLTLTIPALGNANQISLG
jgi:hypothetical protein